jgi:hypothetical protein
MSNLQVRNPDAGVPLSVTPVTALLYACHSSRKLANCILDPPLHRELSTASLTTPAGSVEGAIGLEADNKKMEDSRITWFFFFFLSPSRLGNDSGQGMNDSIAPILLRANTDQQLSSL